MITWLKLAVVLVFGLLLGLTCKEIFGWNEYHVATYVLGGALALVWTELDLTKQKHTWQCGRCHFKASSNNDDVLLRISQNHQRTHAFD